MNTPSSKNRLSQEKSPYLLQHASNPVDWYPWGKEAFERAIAEEKPIFLSIGYATCHWCHVMERETFSREEIAKLMNETFINIKVDREEHPHIDSVYMEFAQALMSSAGGWPLNVVLTPDLKPFFAVTYLPPTAQKGLIGMDQFALQIQMLWRSEEREMLISQADKIVDVFQQSAKSKGEELPGEEQISHAVDALFDIADPIYGGMRGAPKFPLSYQAEFFLQYSKEHADSRCLFYVELTLQMMASGGIFDQLGGGFSRYCVDERWTVPHFEKMLYDNAILAKTYTEVYRYGKKPFFKKIALEILSYLEKEMRHPQGGFFSAEDADSEGQEGKFYTWSKKEIEEILSPEEAELFCRYYGIYDRGEFEGKNILHLPVSSKEFAEAFGLSEEELDKRMHPIKQKVLIARNSRTRPFKDDKILTAWNGLAIDAFATAGFCFGVKAYREIAAETALWIEKNLFVEGQLMRRFRDKEARFCASLEDYAFLIKGLLTLFQVGLGTNFLQWAMLLTDVLEREFKAPQGAFYQAQEEPYLLLRRCEFYDGAEPSGNAVHSENLLRLYQLTQEKKYLLQAEDILKAAKPHMEAFPPAACYHLLSLQRYLNQKIPLVVVAYDENYTHKEEIEALLGSHFCPHASIVWKHPGDKMINQLLPSVAGQNCTNGKTTLYVCKGPQCEAGHTEMSKIKELIEHL